MTYINVFTEGSTKVYEFSHQVKIALKLNFFQFWALFGFGTLTLLISFEYWGGMVFLPIGSSYSSSTFSSISFPHPPTEPKSREDIGLSKSR